MRRKRPYTEPDRIKERIRTAIQTRRNYRLNQSKLELAIGQAKQAANLNRFHESHLLRMIGDPI